MRNVEVETEFFTIFSVICFCFCCCPQTDVILAATNDGLSQLVLLKKELKCARYRDIELPLQT